MMTNLNLAFERLQWGRQQEEEVEEAEEGELLRGWRGRGRAQEGEEEAVEEVGH